jgi:hypothetical protein
MTGLVCDGCGTVHGKERSWASDTKQWWTLTNYRNISGRFCGECYNKISHDAYGNPNNPEEYLLMLLKLGAPQPS